MLVNPSAKNSNNKEINIKKKVHVMSVSSVENYFLWTNDVHYIVKEKSCSSLESKLDIESLLSEKILKEWTTTKTTVVKKLIGDNSSSGDKDTKQDKYKKTAKENTM